MNTQNKSTKKKSASAHNLEAFSPRVQDSKAAKAHLELKTKVQIAAILLLLLAIITYAAWDVMTGGPLTQLFQNREQLIAMIQGWGIFAPIAYLILQVLQTVFAPIPGNVVGLIGGAIFNWWGVLLTIIGSAVGFLIVFSLSRKFGRPLVEKVVKKENLDKLDFIIGKNAPVILFIIFLIPGLPDDIVAYIAGLTEVKIKNLLVLAILGRLPAVAITNYMGMGVTGEADLRTIAIIAVITAIVLAIIAWQKDRLFAAFKKLNQGEKSK